MKQLSVNPNISKVMKNRWAVPEYREKMKKKWKGRTPWNKGLSKKTDKRLATYWKGKKRPGLHTEEAKKRIGAAHKGERNANWKGGKPKCIDCGKEIHYSSKRCHKCANSHPERLKIMRRPKLCMRGENHPRWVKDRGKLIKNVEKHERNNKEYYHWRWLVFERDNHVCKVNNKDCKGKVIAHHILPWRDFPELRYEINNGITLCPAHHPRKRAEEKRLVPFFQGLVSVSKEPI